MSMSHVSCLLAKSKGFLYIKHIIVLKGLNCTYTILRQPQKFMGRDQFSMNQYSLDTNWISGGATGINHKLYCSNLVWWLKSQLIKGGAQLLIGFSLIGSHFQTQIISSFQEGHKGIHYSKKHHQIYNSDLKTDLKRQFRQRIVKNFILENRVSFGLYWVFKRLRMALQIFILEYIGILKQSKKALKQQISICIINIKSVEGSLIVFYKELFLIFKQGSKNLLIKRNILIELALNIQGNCLLSLKENSLCFKQQRNLRTQQGQLDKINIQGLASEIGPQYFIL
ncbi:unnamed protein product [Paramecium pentaurelia]|uniref:Uncharacterized protein n=1 Tax=Paramecium pentaurelia TaxID=43138 RepID=A0A8S1UB24_9CILI|nr:unnamed protein product [Paramecium pentaurelia]